MRIFLCRGIHPFVQREPKDHFGNADDVFKIYLDESKNSERHSEQYYEYHYKSYKDVVDTFDKTVSFSK